MVRVNGPMMSLGASGTLAGTIVFSSWKGRPYVRERVIPSNPKSGAQVGRRVMLKFLAQRWDALSPVQKATWDNLADQDVISNFNAYVKANMKLWHNYLPPSQQSDRSESGNGSDNVLTAAAWEENRIKLSIAGSLVEEQWGLIVYATDGTGFTPAVGNAIIVKHDTTVAAHDVFWTPPTRVEWFFNSQTFADDGVMESAGGEQSAAP